MLVTLGTNQGISANSSHTFTYSPSSMQRIFLKFDDDAVTKLTTRVTIQVGSRTILNGVSVFGLQSLSTLQSGFISVSADQRTSINFGSHQFSANDNLYVTVNSVVAQNAVDCSALVNEPGKYNPLKITEYSDSTFTSEYVYVATSYESTSAVIDEDDYVCEIRTATESSAPSFISANNWHCMSAVANTSTSEYGLLVSKDIPQTTTFNYSSSAATNRILVVQAMPKNSFGSQKARQSQRVALSTLPASLRNIASTY